MAGMTYAEEILEHHGVKGMKWGVRKNGASGTAKADKKFESKGALYRNAVQVQQMATHTFKYSKNNPGGKYGPDRKSINAKYDKLLSNTDFKQNNQVYKQYREESRKAFMSHVQAHAKELDKNASGTRQYTVETHPKFPNRWIIKTTEVQHDSAQVEVDLVLDTKGLITDIKPVKALAQSSISANDILEHHGVKGMKWGKRKNAASSDSAKKTSVKTAAKKQGLHTVSNKDLQDAITRMNLEQNFKRLKVNEQSAATRWVSSTLLEVGKREVQTAVAKKVAGTIAKKVATGGAG